jgi:hypothetical protein
MYSIAGANMPSGKVDVNELAGDDGLGLGGIVSLLSYHLLAALCHARQGERRQPLRQFRCRIISN